MPKEKVIIDIKTKNVLMFHKCSMKIYSESLSIQGELQVLRASMLVKLLLNFTLTYYIKCKL